MARLRDVARMLADESIKTRNERTIASGKENNWPFWWDGLPVPKEMSDLMPEIQRAMPRAKFLVKEVSRVNQNGSSCWVVDEVCVYMDEYPFDFGTIGYRDYNVKRNREKVTNTFGIYSRKIRNEKYSSRNDQYHMVLTKDIKKAVKAALTYLVPYSHKELATAFYDKLRESVSSRVEQIRNDVMNVLRPLHSSKVLLDELKHLASLGVNFRTPEFATAVTLIAEKEALHREEEQRNTSAMFVRFREVDGLMYVDVQECTNIKKSYTLTTSTPNVTYPLEDLPQDTAASVSVLQILNDGQYVPHVGMKINANTFWVERA